MVQSRAFTDRSADGIDRRVLVDQTPRRLSREDFNRPTLRVARDLLGKFIVHRYRGRTLSVMISETEAYKGPRDRAAHSYGGRRTQRVEPLYADGGTAYVYFVYGVHWMLNFSTAGEGLPEGVLIRGIVVAEQDTTKALAGPGRVTQYLKIDKRLDRANVTTSRRLWLEDRGVRVRAGLLRRGPRIGVDYAGQYWATRPWRFWIEPNVARELLSTCVQQTTRGLEKFQSAPQ
jgi:DNA-3-methyladenine glycosylase